MSEGAGKERRLSLDVPGLINPQRRIGSRASDLLNDHIARIESLKIKVLSLPGLSERVRSDIFRDLDTLRGALVQSTSLRGNIASVLDERRAGLGNTTPGDLKLIGILGQSPRVQKLLKIIAKTAPTDLTVVMEGETGSGKELFARIIHNNSRRSHFVAVNCGAFPSGLIESELFGHVKGAFTGATHDRKGKFEEANGGTIFLDEIGELEMIAQVKLLRVVQEGELQRVGSDATIKTNVRVIAATNRNLAEMVRRGQFREDLYYRINMCPLFIPPLRERRDEIRILLEYFFEEICAAIDRPRPVLDRELQRFIFDQYDFPGNIRELKNLAHYLTHIADQAPLMLDELPERYARAIDSARHATVPAPADSEAGLDGVREAAEREHLERLLERHGGDVRALCAELDLSRSRLYQLCKKYGIQPGIYRRKR